MISKDFGFSMTNTFISNVNNWFYYTIIQKYKKKNFLIYEKN